MRLMQAPATQSDCKLDDRPYSAVAQDPQHGDRGGAPAANQPFGAISFRAPDPLILNVAT